MEVRVQQKEQILLNLLAAWIGPVILATLFYFAIAAVGFVVLFRYLLPETQSWLAWTLGLTAATAFVVAIAMLWAWWAGNRMANYRLALDNDTLIFRGQTLSGFREKRYLLSDIASISLGEELNAFDRAMEKVDQILPKRALSQMSTQVIKDLKAGRMIVTDKSGSSECLQLVDIVFDGQSFATFFVELNRRGVVIQGPGWYG